MNSPHFHPLKGKTGLRRLVNAGRYSKDGFQAALRHEAAFRQLVLLNSILILFALFSSFGVAVKMVLVGASFLSLIVELINTGLEAVVDDISLENRPLAKRAKDVGSAAQFLALILLLILWIVALRGD